MHVEGLLGFYRKAQVDLENLNLIDRANALAKEKLAQTVKDIYRVTVAQGKMV